ncbi:hypothetical protein AAFC00_000064 [Neodothiora populina]|uniref:Zn(2)-C6 fungal-type domain-containing protein n=1 Tax=Neodothiora populina TaxID=2781224 RepID=A0ABR3P1U3_9PEZI
MQNDRPRKLQRISQACDLCHRRSIRCRSSNEDPERCQNCFDFDVACTYDRPSKRKKHPQAPTAPRDSIVSDGVPPTQPMPPVHGSISSGSSMPRSQTGTQTGIPDYVEIPPTGSASRAPIDLVNINRRGKGPDHAALVIMRAGSPEHLEVPWKAFALASEDVILELFDIFVRIIYPLYPLMDRAPERARLERREHLTDRGFFSAVMAVCALTSARVRDGAYPSPVSDALRKPEASSEIFFTAAKDSMSKDYSRISQTSAVEYIRTCTLLSLTCIQYGRSADVQQYLGNAFTLAAMHRFYDERSWPQDLDDATKEIYRRVYWSTYMLDVYSAVVWNCFLRSQEIHAYVRYPAHVHNDNLSTHNSPKATGQPVSWIVGWNFSLDLYRVLEHVVNKARAKKFSHDDRRSVDSLVFADTFSDHDVMQTVLNLYYQLPHQFKETLPMTGDLGKDIFGFQAANIQATLQLLRMILFSLEDGPGVERKCDVANEVLQVFHTIPLPYLRAISTPLVYQLGSIGQILGSVLEDPISQSVYQRVRISLNLMADLLQGLESSLHRAAGAAQGLREKVRELDEYMRRQHTVEQRHTYQHSISMPMGSPNDPLQGKLVPEAMMQSLSSIPNFSFLPEMRMNWPWHFYPDDSGQSDQLNG